MIKRILLATVFLAGAVGVLMNASPKEFQTLVGMAANAMLRLWDNLEANPIPVGLAVGTFLLTVALYKVRGKSLRESVEAAATRVMVVPVPAPPAAVDESAVLARAKARAMRTQLIADQIALENRCRKLPEALRSAEQDVCYTEQSVTDAERVLAERKKAHDIAVGKLNKLSAERAAGAAELNAIAVELRKLAEVV